MHNAAWLHSFKSLREHFVVEQIIKENNLNN